MIDALLSPGAIEGGFTGGLAGNLAGYAFPEGWPDGELLEALPFFRELLLANGEDGFNTWLIVSVADGEIVGSAGFIGRPDEAGAVEIGFGIDAHHRRAGYCREAVIALVRWVLSRDSVSRVRAWCEPSNLASGRVLERCGFRQTGENDGLLEWTYMP